MACACKVNKGISQLHKTYGNAMSVNRKEKFNFYTREGVYNIIAYLMVLLISPLIMCYIIYNTWVKKNNKISVSKLLHFKK